MGKIEDSVPPLHVVLASKVTPLLSASGAVVEPVSGGGKAAEKVPLGELLPSDTSTTSTTDSTSAHTKTIVVLLRRFGCPICQMSAANLMALHPILRRNGVRMVAIGLEALNFNEFREASGWSIGIGYDDTAELYDQLGAEKVGGICCCCKWLAALPTAISTGNRAKKLGFKGNYEGNRSQFGGTFVYNADSTCCYAFRHTSSAFEPDMEALLQSLDLPPAELDAARKMQYPESATATKQKK